MIGKDPINTDQLDYLFDDDFYSLFSGDSADAPKEAISARLSVEYKIVTVFSSTDHSLEYSIADIFNSAKLTTEYAIRDYFGNTNENILYKIIADQTDRALYAYYKVGLVQPPLNAFIIDSITKEQ